MEKSMALLVLREKMRNPGEDELVDGTDFLFSAVQFFSETDMDTLTEENILTRYILFLEDMLGIEHIMDENGKTINEKAG